ELGCIIGDAEAERLEIREPSAELLPLLHMRDGALQAKLRAPKRAGRDVEAPAVERAHGDLEALPLGADAVGGRDAARFEYYHGGRLRVPAEVFLLRAEGEPGGAILDQEARDAVRAPFSRARHHEVDVGTAAARNERLGAIEHVMIAAAPRAGFQAGGVRAGVRLGQAVAGELRHAAEIGKKALPQFPPSVG